MSHGLADLTLPVVMQEIEDVLEEYPEHPYQSAFAIPELRQKLIDHVFSHSPSRHVGEGKQEASSNSKAQRPSFLQERLRLEMLIRGSMLHLLRENAAWLSQRLPHV